jgi:hypothetical protein
MRLDTRRELGGAVRGAWDLNPPTLLERLRRRPDPRPPEGSCRRARGSGGPGGASESVGPVGAGRPRREPAEPSEEGQVPAGSDPSRPRAAVLAPSRPATGEGGQRRPPLKPGRRTRPTAPGAERPTARERGAVPPPGRGRNARPPVPVPRAGRERDGNDRVRRGVQRPDEQASRDPPLPRDKSKEELPPSALPDLTGTARKLMTSPGTHKRHSLALSPEPSSRFCFSQEIRDVSKGRGCNRPGINGV